MIVNLIVFLEDDNLDFYFVGVGDNLNFGSSNEGDDLNCSFSKRGDNLRFCIYLEVDYDC